MSTYYQTEMLRLKDQLAELNRQVIVTRAQLTILERLIIYQYQYKKRPLSLPEKMVDTGLIKFEQLIGSLVASIIKVRK